MNELQKDKKGALKFLIFILFLLAIIIILSKTNFILFLGKKVDPFWQGIISIIIGVSVIFYTKLVDHSKSIMASNFRGYGSGIIFVILGLTLILKSCGIDKMIH